MTWHIHHKAETVSTNADAAAGVPGDVFTADWQSAGRGRLDHRWCSVRSANLMMSVVIGVDGHSAESVATLPLVVGLAVAKACGGEIKWPNDVLFGGRKLAGILCERHGDRVIAGIGVNVRQTDWPGDLADRATSLALLGQCEATVESTRDLVLSRLSDCLAVWGQCGFSALFPEIASRDFLRGQEVSVCRTDGDPEPARGVSGGIRADGALDVAGEPIWAGEAHVTIRKREPADL